MHHVVYRRSTIFRGYRHSKVPKAMNLPGILSGTAQLIIFGILFVGGNWLISKYIIDYDTWNANKAHPVVPGSSISRASGSNPKRGWVRFFREVLIGLGACRSLSGGAAPRAGPSARLCGDCRARRYPSNSTGDGARRARARFRMRRAGRSADCIGRQTR